MRAEIMERKPLTPAERRVIGGLCEALSNKDIADALCVTEYTVKRHLGNICDKTGFSSRLEVTVWALKKTHAAEIKRLRAMPVAAAVPMAVAE